MDVSFPALRQQEDEATRIKRPFAWFDLVAGVILLVAVGLLIRSLAGNEKLAWGTVGHYLFDSTILRGVRTTILIAVVCMALACLVGLVSGLFSQSHSRVLRLVAAVYVWLFRGTPVLVQLIFWYNIALLFPTISLGFGSWATNTVVSPLTAAMIGLTLAEGAFMSEIIRAGIQSVDRGQLEAATALGMRRRQALRVVVLPQAIRLTIPPTGNEFITMLKGTSLVAVISVKDLLFNAQQIYNVNYQVPALLIVASVWYIAMTSAATVGQGYLERYFERRS